MTATLVRQRPGWWTQFGRSILAAIPQVGFQAADAAIRGALQNYFAKQYLEQQSKQREALAKSAFERSKGLALERDRQARDAAARRGVAATLMGIKAPETIGAGAQFALEGTLPSQQVLSRESPAYKPAQQPPPLPKEAAASMQALGMKPAEFQARMQKGPTVVQGYGLPEKKTVPVGIGQKITDLLRQAGPDVWNRAASQASGFADLARVRGKERRRTATLQHALRMREKLMQEAQKNYRLARSHEFKAALAKANKAISLLQANPLTMVATPEQTSQQLEDAFSSVQNALNKYQARPAARPKRPVTRKPQAANIPEDAIREYMNKYGVTYEQAKTYLSKYFSQQNR